MCSRTEAAPVREPGGCSHAEGAQGSVCHSCATVPAWLSLAGLIPAGAGTRAGCSVTLFPPTYSSIHLQEEGEHLSLLQAEQAAHSALSLARGGSLSLPLAEGRALQIRTHVTGSVPALGRLQPRHGASACPGTSGVSFSSKPCFQLGLDVQIVPLLLEASS